MATINLNYYNQIAEKYSYLDLLVEILDKDLKEVGDSVNTHTKLITQSDVKSAIKNIKENFNGEFISPVVKAPCILVETVKLRKILADLYGRRFIVYNDSFCVNARDDGWIFNGYYHVDDVRAEELLDRYINGWTEGYQDA